MASDKNSSAARAARARLEDRRRAQAEAGEHLPSVRELYLGFPFLLNSIIEDVKTWAQRTMSATARDTEPNRRVIAALATLTVDGIQLPAFCAARDALKSARDVPEGILADYGLTPTDWIYSGPDIGPLCERLDFYQAALGHPEACVAVARRAAEIAIDLDLPDDLARRFATASIGWMAAASDASPDRIHGGSDRFLSTQNRAARLGGMVVRAILADDFRARENSSAGGSGALETHHVNKRGGTQAAMAAFIGDDEPDVHDVDAAIKSVREQYEADVAARQAAERGPGILVIREVAAADSYEGRKIADRFKSITGKRVPLKLAPSYSDFSVCIRNLRAEFPHASEIIDSVLSDMQPGEPIRLRPLLLVGDPGCGKTTFARRLTGMLGLPAEVYACGGAADNSIGGTPRRWSTAEACLPLSQIVRHGLANPAIVLDEIEKTASANYNGNLLNALVSMTESASAESYHDPYIQAAVDISRVIWLATANGLDAVPDVLRDRFRILRFPNPGPEHLKSLAAAALKSVAAQRGLSPAWCATLDGLELDLLAQHWRGGSIRKLQRLVEGVLAARDKSMARA